MDLLAGFLAAVCAVVNALDLLACCLFSGLWSNAWILLACFLPGVQGSIGWTCLLACAVLRAPSIAGLLPAGVRCTSLIFFSFSGDTPCFGPSSFFFFFSLSLFFFFFFPVIDYSTECF